MIYAETNSVAAATISCPSRKASLRNSVMTAAAFPYAKTSMANAAAATIFQFASTNFTRAHTGTSVSHRR